MRNIEMEPLSAKPMRLVETISPLDRGRKPEPSIRNRVHWANHHVFITRYGNALEDGKLFETGDSAELELTSFRDDVIGTLGIITRELREREHYRVVNPRDGTFKWYKHGVDDGAHGSTRKQ